ncbi:hypothetical protein Vadar_011798 [Vaccinium darrowii]|uniref:Uncharacterized protein n=1 Tax=Vaccinium darrowii TaxID=229202 RepID=A0ACB7ZC32_9ERIC|nr:hypothetical protein Vadar_011798 [Vaccinium darrowii]
MPLKAFSPMKQQLKTPLTRQNPSRSQAQDCTGLSSNSKPRRKNSERETERERAKLEKKKFCFGPFCRCSANAQKIRSLLLESPTKKTIVRYREPKDEDKVKVVNLPTTVDKIQYPTVEGTVCVTNFNQKFFYFACSKCRKATNASEDGEFWCNYCMEEVPASPSSACFVASSREKLNTDATFHELLFQISGEEIMENTVNMYDYGGISQCKFDIKAFSDAPMLMDKRTSEAPLLMAPTTPNKKSKTEAYDAAVSEDNQAGTTSPAKINETKTAQGKLLFKAKKNDLTIEREPVTKVGALRLSKGDQGCGYPLTGAGRCGLAMTGEVPLLGEAGGQRAWLRASVCQSYAGLAYLEQEMEMVITILQPGPLGIVEHKFSSEGIREANATVKRAVENWRRNANGEARVEYKRIHVVTNYTS